MTKIGFKLEAEGSAQAAGNVQKLVDEVTKLDNEITDLNKSMRELKKEGKMEEFTVAKRKVDDLKYSKQQLNKQIRDNRKELDLQKKSLDDLIGSVRIGGVSVNEFKTVLGKTTTGLQVSSKATLANVTALKAFKVALAATGIGLIVIALGALVTYLTKTQKGMDFVNKVAGAMQALFGRLIERIAKFGEGLFKVLTFNVSGFSDMADSIQGIGKDLVQTTKDGYNLAGAMNDLAQEEIGLTVILAERRRKMKDLEEISKNVALSEKERTDAAKEALAIAQQVGDMEEGFLTRKIELLREQQALGITNRADDAELAALIADRDQKSAANTKNATKLQSQLNTAMGVFQTRTKDLVEGPMESMRKKLTEVQKLIAGGSLEGNALRDKIVEMLDLKGEVDAMEEKIRAITEEVSRGAAPTTFGQLETGRIGLEQQTSEKDPRVGQTRLTEDEIRAIRKENNEKMLKDYQDRIAAELALDKKHHEEKLDLLAGFSQDVGSVVGGILSDGFETFKDFEDALLVTLVDGIEKAINVLLAQAFARQFADKPAPLALAAFGVITGLVKGFFNGVKSGITKREKGGIRDGILSGPSHAQGGIPIGHDEGEGGEAFINKKSTAKFRGVLSAINSYNGWGRKFASGGIRAGNNIPSFVGVNAAQGVSLSPLSATASIADESIAAMAGALGSAVRQGIGAGLQDAHRMNERENVYQRTSRV